LAAGKKGRSKEPWRKNAVAGGRPGGDLTWEESCFAMHQNLRCEIAIPLECISETTPIKRSGRRRVDPCGTVFYYWREYAERPTGEKKETGQVGISLQGRSVSMGKRTSNKMFK